MHMMEAFLYNFNLIKRFIKTSYAAISRSIYMEPFLHDNNSHRTLAEIILYIRKLKLKGSYIGALQKLFGSMLLHAETDR